jgi:hypothetical protein
MLRLKKKTMLRSFSLRYSEPRPHKVFVHLRHFLLLALLAVSIQSCRVSLVPDYSETLEKQIISAQKLTDKLYLELLTAAPAERTYESCKKKYTDIELEINSILFQNQARPKNTDMLAIVNTLKKKFAEYKEYHKTKGTLSDGEIQIYEADMMAFWQPLLVAEKGLKKAKK